MKSGGNLDEIKDYSELNEQIKVLMKENKELMESKNEIVGKFEGIKKDLEIEKEKYEKYMNDMELCKNDERVKEMEKIIGGLKNDIKEIESEYKGKMEVLGNEKIDSIGMYVYKYNFCNGFFPYIFAIKYYIINR